MKGQGRSPPRLLRAVRAGRTGTRQRSLRSRRRGACAPIVTRFPPTLGRFGIKAIRPGPQGRLSAEASSSQARSHSTQQTKFTVGCCGLPNFVVGFQFKMFVVTFLTQAQELARSVFAGVAGFLCVQPGMCEVCLNPEVWKSVAADNRIPLALLPPREHDRNRFPTSHVERHSHMVVLLVKTNLETDLLDAVIHIQFCASNLGSCPG